MELRNDKRFRGLGEVLSLSWPASLSMLNRTAMQFVDGLMVSRLGPVTFAAQSMAGLFAFVPESFAMGVLGVVNTYVSQNFGAGRKRRCGSYAWAGIMLSLVFAALMIPLAGFAPLLFGWIGHAAELQPLESLYFRYMILAAFLTLSSRVLEAFFYAIHRPRVVLTTSLISNLFNVAANYVLIFGMYGFPKLGLQGAAIGTVASWGLQLAILLSVFLSARMSGQFGTRLVRAMRLRQCREILKIGWPAGVRFCIDIFTWAIFTGVYIAGFGTVHLAAATAAVRYMTLSFMPAVGVSIATTALVGKYIGKGQPDLARRRAHSALIVAMAYMGTCAIAFLVFRRPMVRLFVVVSEHTTGSGLDAEQIISIGGRIMICAAVFQIFDALGIVFNGALRGAGDTLWPMIISVASALVILMGGGWLMVSFLPQLESLGPYIAATAYVIILGILMAWRFEGGSWRKIDLLAGDTRRR